MLGLTCKVRDNTEAQLLDLTDVGAESSVDHREDVRLDVLGRSLLEQQVHPLHEDQEDLYRLHHLHHGLEAGQDVPGVVLAAGRVRDLEAAGEDEGNHVGVDKLLGEAGEHAVDADAGGELGQNCGQTLVQTCKRCLTIFRSRNYCFSGSMDAAI